MTEQEQIPYNFEPTNDSELMASWKHKFAKGGMITQTELSKVIPSMQFMVMKEAKEEYPFMIKGVKDALDNIPPMYAQDGKGKNAVVWLHYFHGGSDWYITELDKESNVAFGYVILNQDSQMSEFGQISLDELVDIDLMNLDLYWSVKTLNQAFQQANYQELVQEPVEIYEEVVEIEEVVNSEVISMHFANDFEKNLAIRELIDEKGDSTDNYTIEEKEFISTYSGMGGLEKFGAKGKGLLYEYYTPNSIIEKMWGLAYKYHKIEIKNVLEPSCATGRFIGLAPKGVNIDGFDIDKYSLSVCKILYPQDNHSFHLESFEKMFFNNRNKSIKDNIQGMEQYDLIIGNPPYGEYAGMYAGMGEKSHTGASNYIEYFIDRGLDVLKKDGLLVFIIGTVTQAGGIPFLDKKPNKSIKRIQEKSDLVDAYRLGIGAFDTTDVDSDIIVLRKK